MKKYLIIKADTNDGDYITSKHEVEDKHLDLLYPIFEVLQNQRKEYLKSKNWGERHNWECGEIDDGRTPQKLYVETDLLTEEQVHLFEQYLPNDEYGLHTIEDIEIMYVSNTKKII